MLAFFEINSVIKELLFIFFFYGGAITYKYFVAFFLTKYGGTHPAFTPA